MLTASAQIRTAVNVVDLLRFRMLPKGALSTKGSKLFSLEQATVLLNYTHTLKAERSVA